jgi:transposase
VTQWKKELFANAGSLFEGKRGPKPVNAQSDPDRLYAKIGQLNVELDWLKKSPDSAYRGTTKVARARRSTRHIHTMQTACGDKFGCV